MIRYERKFNISWRKEKENRENWDPPPNKYIPQSLLECRPFPIHPSETITITQRRKPVIAVGR